MPPTFQSRPAAGLARPLLLRLAAGALIALLAGCATRTPAPVVERAPLPPPRPVVVTSPPSESAPAPAPPPAQDWRPQTYTVKRGDTLHQIALDHGLDYRELAGLNNIENPNMIRVGQVLRLSAGGEPGAAPAGAGVVVTPLRPGPAVVAGEARPPPAAAGSRNTDVYKTQPKAVKEPYSEQALSEVQRLASAAPGDAAAPGAVSAAPAAVPPPAAAPPPAAVARADAKPAPEAPDDSSDRIDWQWPAAGKVLSGFSDTANLKGIDIAGKVGQPVVASATGKVVYAGSGLRGYGKLVIVKHNSTYLSAYAHNSDIIVKEGQQVTRGQKIAEMGSTDSDQVKLHFEIRRLGKPVDPLKYLPPA